MTRTIRTNFIRALQRQNVDSTPFPKASDDISLVNVVSDTSHLGPMVTNAHIACGVVQAAAGAGTFSGCLITAPASRTLAVYNIRNTITVASPGDIVRMGLDPVAAFTPTVASACMEWGDEAAQGVIFSGTFNAALTGDVFQYSTGTVGITPIYIAPGETLGIAHLTANALFVQEVAWEEFG